MDEQNLPVGVQLRQYLRDGISSSHAIVAIISEAYLSSRWTLMELGAAWVSDLLLFQVLIDIKRSNAPLPDLVSCDLSEIDSRLVDSLKELKSNVTGATKAENNELDRQIAAEIERVIRSSDVDQKVVEYVENLLSTDINVRIKAQQEMQKNRQIRDSTLGVLTKLLVSFNDHVRAEAYFCLGTIPNSECEFVVDEHVLAFGLRDTSLWVAACCAAGLRERVPLQQYTLDVLSERTKDAKALLKSDLDAAALCFRGQEALEAHRLAKRS